MHKEQIKHSLKKFTTLLVQQGKRVSCLLLHQAKKTGCFLVYQLKKLGCLLLQYTRQGLVYLKFFSGKAWRYLQSHWPAWRERVRQYILLTRIDRPIGVLLLLWPTLWALWIAADGTPDPDILLIFVTGVFCMRAAGCVINDIADRNLDLHVERTQKRPITTGKVSVREALLVFLVLISIALLLVLQLNVMTIKLSLVALVLAVIYPFTKRYTYMPQVFLGAAFGWAIPMAFSAQSGELPPVAWLLFMAAVLWAVVYDTMYAMVDRKDDIKVGIKSTAILFEDADRTIIGIIQVLVLISLLMVGSREAFTLTYYIGLIAASMFFIYQQYLIKDRIRERCFAAFLNNNWFGATVFVGIVLNYYFA